MVVVLVMFLLLIVLVDDFMKRPVLGSRLAIVFLTMVFLPDIFFLPIIFLPDILPPIILPPDILPLIAGLEVMALGAVGLADVVWAWARESGARMARRATARMLRMVFFGAKNSPDTQNVTPKPHALQWEFVQIRPPSSHSEKVSIRISRASPNLAFGTPALCRCIIQPAATFLKEFEKCR
jgi:hypothetical protein